MSTKIALMVAAAVVGLTSANPLRAAQPSERLIVSTAPGALTNTTNGESSPESRVLPVPNPSRTTMATETIAREENLEGQKLYATTADEAQSRPSRTEQPLAANVKGHRKARHMTVTVINSYGRELSTVHDRARYAPAPTGDTGAGRMKHGQKSVFKVRNGWSGKVAVNEAQFHVPVGDESLIEGSFMNQGNGYPQGDINVSYVDGFTAPIVCWCNENNLFTGCSKDLHQHHKCPSPNGQGSCKNGNRGKKGITGPVQFFSPCHFPGGAYTFDADDLANNLNQGCPKEQYTCCIGTLCPKNPAQG